MLTKPEPLEIPEDDPFQNDSLARKEPVENIARLISTITQPFTVAVEGRWGSGKTVFLRMLSSVLENNGNTCIYFNAWEVDFINDPLIAFIGEIHSQMNELVNGNKSKAIKKAWNILKAITTQVVKRGVPGAVKSLTKGAIDSDEIQSAIINEIGSEFSSELQKLAAEKIEEYFNGKESVRGFKDALANFVEKIQEQNNQQGKVVFLIDELDRCRPDFAVNLLERIKHFFSVKGIIFVIAIDERQLIGAVRGIFGQDLDGDGYLRKFIDMRFTLPEPSIHTFVDQLWNRFDMDSWLATKPGHISKADILSTFTMSMQFFKLSLRALEQCFTEYNAILRMATQQHLLLPDATAFLIALRAKNPELFVDYSIGKEGLESIKQYLKKLGTLAYFAKYDQRIESKLSVMLQAFSKYENDISNHTNELTHYLAHNPADVHSSQRFATLRIADAIRTTSAAFFQRLNLLK